MVPNEKPPSERDSEEGGGGPGHLIFNFLFFLSLLIQQKEKMPESTSVRIEDSMLVSTHRALENPVVSWVAGVVCVLLR